MKTNMQMLDELNKAYDAMPHTHSIVTEAEITLIQKELCLKEMDLLQLLNLRDFVVLFLSSHRDVNFDTMDKISAITSIIDLEIMKKGGVI